MVNAIAAITALITYLGTMSVTILCSAIPDGNATSLQTFPGVPAKLLMLTAKETGIAATYSNYNFGGFPQAGSQAGATLSLTGAAAVPPTAHVVGYTNLTWNFQGIGVTAATVPIITYILMM